MTKPQNIGRNDEGFASMVIALTIVIVLALLTVGFAKLARQEQQNALNKQLSAQAYYAAESGINDAIYDIENGYITGDGNNGTARANDESCMSVTTSHAKTSDREIDTARGVSYSCLLVGLELDSLEFSDLGPSTTRAITFSPTSSLSTLMIKWASSDGNTNFRSFGDNGRFTPASDWTSPPVLQFSITPLFNNKISFTQRSFTVFLYPSSAGADSIAYSTNDRQQGQIISGKCTSTTNCQSTITSIPSAPKYLITMQAYYKSADLKLTGNGPGGTAVAFNGQAEIDVTGKAQNVLKRLKVRVPVNQPGAITGSRPNYALEAQNICKRIKTNENQTVFDTPTSLQAQVNTHPALGSICKLDE